MIGSPAHTRAMMQNFLDNASDNDVLGMFATIATAKYITGTYGIDILEVVKKQYPTLFEDMMHAHKTQTGNVFTPKAKRGLDEFNRRYNHRSN